MRRYILLIFTLIAFLCQNLIGQGIYYQTLGNKQGLSQLSAVSFWQDNIGRIWIGNDALNRYDGEDVKVFRASEHLNGIEDSNIHSLCGNDSILFFLAENSLVSFNLTLETFHNPDIFTYSICYSNGKVYYMSRNGLFSAYDWETNTSETIVSLPDTLIGSDFILEKEEGEFWVATPSGVFVVNEDEKRVTNRILTDEHIVYLHKDFQGYIWMATQNHKIFLYTPEQEVIPLEIKGNKQLSAPVFSNSIFCIQEDIKGTIWIGTLTGIYRLTREKGTTGFILQDHILSESTIYALFSDKQGTIWIGSYYGDVKYFNPSADNYTYYSTDESNPSRLHGAVIGQITKDKDGNMYFASEGSGINILRAGSNTFEHITMENGLPQNKIRDLWYDEEHDRLFISAYMEGLCYLDLKTDKIVPVKHGALETIHQRIVESIQPYKNELILRTQNGLFRLNRSTLEIHPFFEEKELKERCSGIIRSVFIDEKDMMWVSSFRHGLFTIDLKKKKILKQYGDGIKEDSKIPSAVIKIGGDSKYGLYFVTLKSGILKYIEAPDTFQVFNKEEHQLLSNICYNLAFTPNGKLVVTSNKGISLLDISADNKITSSYSIRINPTSPLTAFIGDCGLYVSSGEDDRIYAGGIYGLFCFSEKDLPVEQDAYSLFFSSLLINNEDISPASSLLDKSFYQTQKLILPYNKNTLSIKFASSNYLSSRTSQYTYRLEGLDEFWTDINHKTIIYNSLRPGNYKLVVRELGNSSKVAELAITVKPPIWATWPAIIAYFLIISFILWRIIRSNRSKSMLQASLEMERREMSRIEESNRNKMDFFINISNEFRTPLTLILSQLERLISDVPAIGKSKIEKIKTQAVRLQELTSEMLDFRRIEQDNLSLKVRNYSIDEFLQGIYSTFRDYAVEKSLSFRYNSINDNTQLWFDQKQMQRVFYNLLSFIFKIASPKDNITLSLHYKSGLARIYITHKVTSKGEKDIDKFIEILNDENKLYPDISSLPDGAIGIVFSKGIIDLHKGNISVIQEESKRILIIELQTGNSHFDNIDTEDQVEELQSSLPASMTKLLEDDPFWKEYDEKQVKNFHMYLVEEDYEMRKLLKESFSHIYEVTEFQDAETAYEAAVKEKPDIILSKVNLPGISGIEMCHMLKSNIQTYHIPLVLLSSHPTEEQNIESIRAGAEYYIVQPFNIRILFLRCNYLVKNRRKMLQQIPTPEDHEMEEMATNEKEQEFLSMAKQIVEENWSNTHFDISLWSRELGIGRTRFFNQIKSITGMTPNEYLLLLKLNRSQTLLQDKNNLTIAEIAYQLGFSNPAYFSKCFKKQFGVTPQEYKRKK
ncbi:ligand-binding sensor domain-containing protein/DNA-binding response OmpR family regulator [Parabacteroides sp. PF5-5]|uniref:helix-turn-helix domain-containing protein n=1 Tax=unclassified Parabacteroides TaxID=2649774 RepID=UPI0024750290|nr:MULTISPECIES: hybrid sensor histidine kinase/response regulator transcription factor [unclassified Parabacteroides]MDH6303517.1 ligand-binding sensor domain-containing protein/DNA-binding response OmpR family regulator [Parabacteroides sp. PH5-39]MDH6314839.1 ligand-binding sensor domain-containing protein/DNA-binding response OmpR family regulator [Parabacteroides sp. PF5-13]MDH6318176.1 ligand-binding sensor domain-containing protein/DNA-binding response OmpR family regulator [Parabacteroid